MGTGVGIEGAVVDRRQKLTSNRSKKGRQLLQHTEININKILKFNSVFSTNTVGFYLLSRIDECCVQGRREGEGS